MGDVGATKIFESDTILICKFRARAEGAPPHAPARLRLPCLESSTLEIFENGIRLVSFETRPGDTFAFGCGAGELVSADEKEMQAPATHSARNGGTCRYREILVETKR